MLPNVGTGVYQVLVPMLVLNLLMLPMFGVDQSPDLANIRTTSNVPVMGDPSTLPMLQNR